MKTLIYLLIGSASIILLGLLFIPSQKPTEAPLPNLASIPSWSVTLPTQRPDTLDTYDVIVVGSGFGGLSCGALLAKDGYRVLVIEKNEQIGGYGTNYCQNGFTFSHGAEDISGIWERGSITYLLRELNIDERKIVTRNSRRFTLNNESIDIPAADDAFEKVFTKRFPDEADAIRAFFSDAKKVYLEIFDKEATKLWGIPLRKELVATAMSQEWIQNFAATHQLMNEWRSATYLEILNRYFQNDEVKRLLCSMLGYTGSRASKNSALSVTAMSGYFFFGGYRVIGGSQRLADYLASYITEHNGTVLCRHPVDSILVKNNAVIGVKTNNQIFKAPIVVSNVNAKTLYLDLLDRTSLPTKFLQDINDLPLGRSAVQVLLGVSQVFPSYPTLINDMDHGIHIIISSHDDPSSAPLSSSSITLLQSAVTADFPNPSSLEYDSKVAVLLNEMIEKADFSLPGLKDHLVIKKTFTPHDFEKLTAIPNGAIYCFDQSQVPIRPYFKAPIQGLYLANASSSGGGVEAVVIGGITCKHDITGWKRKIR